MVMAKGVTNLESGSVEERQYQLIDDFYSLLNKVDYIYAKQDEWELFKNYLRDHQGIFFKNSNRILPK